MFNTQFINSSICLKKKDTLCRDKDSCFQQGLYYIQLPDSKGTYPSCQGQSHFCESSI